MKRKTKNNLWKVFKIFVYDTWEGIYVIAGIFGFLISQLVWIWILKGFVKFFYNYLNEQSGYSLELNYPRFQTVFWMIYATWFIIVLLLKFTINNRYNRDETKKKT